MKKLTIALHVSIWFMSTSFSQNRQRIDSLIRDLPTSQPDSQRIKTLIQLNSEFWESDLDSSLLFGQQALQLAQQTGNLRYVTLALQRIGGCYRHLGDYPKSLDYSFRALKIADDHQFKNHKIDILGNIAAAYESLKDYPKAISYYQQALALSREMKSAGYITHYESFIAITYSNYNSDSALAYLQKSLIGFDTISNPYRAKTFYAEMAEIQFKQRDFTNAFLNVRRSIGISKIEGSHRGLAIAYNSIADFFRQRNEPDSGKIYASMGLRESQANRFKPEILKSLNILAKLYEVDDPEQSLYYYKEASKINEQLFGAEKNNNLQKTLADEQERRRQVESERIAYKNRVKQYAFLGGFAALIIIVVILYRNNQHRKKANALLQMQKEKIEIQKKDLEQTLNDLRTTQAQLIQSEKMASLGQLTTGIAHEIQNPLNFVNNFSEVSNEMIDEMIDEAGKGNTEGVKAIAGDIKQNLEKITHHGKRADAIVKNMLQHSRTSSSKKEPTDINALCDEYLRLAYHGMRAKDKSFDAKIETSFDNSIERVNIIPQEIGRVLLNLINNAFYAVKEKQSENVPGYEPIVNLTTKKAERKIEIRVADNGGGIPKMNLDKIFQPFFTTKPTGQGTGLGLSLAYDIVKAHGGELKLETREEEGSKFIVELPKDNPD